MKLILCARMWCINPKGCKSLRCRANCQNPTITTVLSSHQQRQVFVANQPTADLLLANTRGGKTTSVQLCRMSKPQQLMLQWLLHMQLELVGSSMHQTACQLQCTAHCPFLLTLLTLRHNLLSWF